MLCNCGYLFAPQGQVRSFFFCGGANPATPPPSPQLPLLDPYYSQAGVAWPHASSSRDISGSATESANNATTTKDSIADPISMLRTSVDGVAGHPTKPPMPKAAEQPLRMISCKKVGSYELGKTLGEGEWGKVKQAVNTTTGEKVAIKVLKKEQLMAQGLTENVKKEIAILKRLKHRHVIQLKEVMASKTRLYLVMEQATGGELFYKLANEGRFEEETARDYFQQLVAGVEYCHSQGICHRDLKPENLLLSEDGTLKISDFGLSALYTTDEGDLRLLHTSCGTPNYVAPEVLAKRGYDGRLADVWSCGCILYTFLVGSLPFNEPSLDVLYDKIKRADYNVPDWVSAECRDVLGKILQPDPLNRITMEGIRQLDWFNMQGSLAEFDGSQVDTEEAHSDLDNVLQEIDDPAPVSDVPGMKSANVFELIARTGALNIGNLLRNSGSSAQIRAISNKTADSFIASTKFVSDEEPSIIMQALINVLQKYSGLHAKVNNPSFKIRVAGKVTNVVVTFIVQIFRLAAGLYLVDFIKGRGDALGFYKLYKILYSQLEFIVLSERVAKARLEARRGSDGAILRASRSQPLLPIKPRQLPSGSKEL